MELDEFIELTGANRDWLKSYTGKEALSLIKRGVIEKLTNENNTLKDRLEEGI